MRHISPGAIWGGECVEGYGGWRARALHALLCPGLGPIDNGGGGGILFNVCRAEREISSNPDPQPKNMKNGY